MRLGNDKLIEFYDTGRRELFDLKADPGESTNLTDRFPDKVEKLAAMLGEDSLEAETVSQQAKPEDPLWFQQQFNPSGTFSPGFGFASPLQREPTHKDTSRTGPIAPAWISSTTRR